MDTWFFTAREKWCGSCCTVPGYGNSEFQMHVIVGEVEDEGILGIVNTWIDLWQELHTQNALILNFTNNYMHLKLAVTVPGHSTTWTTPLFPCWPSVRAMAEFPELKLNLTLVGKEL